jgi:hypothetical protein
MDGASNMATYEELHEFVCDSIVDKTPVAYNNGRGQLTPFYSNDLADKLHDLTGQLLVAYILGNDEDMLKIMHKVCAQEIDSIVDLVG